MIIEFSILFIVWAAQRVLFAFYKFGVLGMLTFFLSDIQLSIVTLTNNNKRDGLLVCLDCNLGLEVLDSSKLVSKKSFSFPLKINIIIYYY